MMKCFVLLCTSLIINIGIIIGQSKNQSSIKNSVAELSNNLARVPPMGWSSWNHFQCDINEKVIMEEADAMVASGMKNAGYEYVNIDDCWMAPKRNSDGNLKADPERFPHGIKYLADYIHKKGLKLGIYSSAGTNTCEHLPASLGHEKGDAKMFAKWGVDYLKYDNCGNQGIPAIKRYTAMKNALADCGRPIVFSICEWGHNNPWVWASKIGNLWRTTEDIRDNWGSMIHIVDQQVDLNSFAENGHWNDPDMLEVGNGGMTNLEYETHFSLWCMLAAPLITGNDLRHMTDETLAILTNKEVIAVDQDPAGIEGYKLEDHGDKEIWVKPLADGSWTVLFLNRSSKPAFMTLKIKDIDIKKSNIYMVRDLWEHTQKQKKDGLVRSDVLSHGIKMYRIFIN